MGSGEDTLVATGDELDAPPRLGRIGHFEVTDMVGRGGMGSVWGARDPELDRRVAIKVLHPGAWGDEAIAVARLQREAQAMARLAHPNVLTVYEVGRFDDRPYIAMELVEGETLRGWMRARRPWRDTLTMLIAAGRGLAAAHAVDLVHRDFKPENVLIGADGRPRVGDFGVVASASDEAIASGSGAVTATQAGQIIGTPAYMAPEQWEHGPIDPRTDQFAFAVVAWEAIWGERPFQGDVEAIRIAVTAGTAPPSPSRRRVPRRIEAALRRALARHPDERWPDLTALLDELERRARDRRPAVAAAAAGMIVAGVLVGVLAGGRGEASSPCRAAGGALDEVWSAARRDALAKAFATIGVEGAGQTWSDVAARIDGWAARFRAMAIETCELGRSESGAAAAVAPGRDECLDRRLGQLDGLLAALEDPDPTVVRYAREAALGLDDPASCRNAQLDVPDPPTALVDRDELAADHGRVARSAALRSLGKPRDAVAIAEEVARRADQLDWPPLVAEAHYELGAGYMATRQHELAEASFERAALQAEAAGVDELRFRATIALSGSAIQRSSFDEAGRLIQSARMIAARLPADDHRLADLAIADAGLAFWRGDFGACVTLGEAAIVAIERASGADAIEGIEPRLDIHRCLTNLGRLDEAGPPLRRALQIADATIAHEHPTTASILATLAGYERRRDHLDEAIALLDDALAIREKILGPDNPDVAAILNNRSNALRDAGRFEEARAGYRRALAIWEATYGADSPAVGVVNSGLGELAMQLEDYPTAVAHFRKTVEIRRAKRPPGHFDIASALVNLGRALLALRDGRCVPLFEEAVASFEADPTSTDPYRLAWARVQLGRALTELGLDRNRGRTLIHEGCVTYDGAGYDSDEKATCARLVGR